MKMNQLFFVSLLAFNSVPASANVDGQSFVGRADCGLALAFPWKSSYTPTANICPVKIRFNEQSFSYVVDGDMAYSGSYIDQGNKIYLNFSGPRDYSGYRVLNVSRFGGLTDATGNLTLVPDSAQPQPIPPSPVPVPGNVRTYVCNGNTELAYYCDRYVSQSEVCGAFYEVYFRSDRQIEGHNGAVFNLVMSQELRKAPGMAGAVGKWRRTLGATSGFDFNVKCVQAMRFD